MMHLKMKIMALGYRNKLTFILLSIFILLISCGDNTTAESNKKKIQKWVMHQPSDKYPHGLFEFNMNGTIFNVPAEYVGVKKNSAFQVSIIWPEFVAVRLTPRWDGEQDRFDVIYMFFHVKKRPKIRNPELYNAFWKEDVGRYDGPYPSNEFKGHQEYRYKGKAKVFLLNIKDVHDFNGEPIVVHCAPPNPNWKITNGLPPQCNSYFYWLNGLSLHVRIFRKNLINAVDIHKKIFSLVRSFTKKIEKNSD